MSNRFSVQKWAESPFSAVLRSLCGNMAGKALIHKINSAVILIMSEAVSSSL